MKYLVTGGCGFLGSNIAAHVLDKNDELIVGNYCQCADGVTGRLESLLRLSLGVGDLFECSPLASTLK